MGNMFCCKPFITGGAHLVWTGIHPLWNWLYMLIKVTYLPCSYVVDWKRKSWNGICCIFMYFSIARFNYPKGYTDLKGHLKKRWKWPAHWTLGPSQLQTKPEMDRWVSTQNSAILSMQWRWIRTTVLVWIIFLQRHFVALGNVVLARMM